MDQSRSITVRLKAEISDFKDQMNNASRSLSDFEKGQQKMGGAAEATMGRSAQSMKLQQHGSGSNQVKQAMYRRWYSLPRVDPQSIRRPCQSDGALTLAPLKSSPLPRSIPPPRNLLFDNLAAFVNRNDTAPASRGISNQVDD